ncbi:hypothetical protein LCGC14_0417170 [marine sediment metagenome]|uniref:Uncharacterized protein n=1 Tax=marine sediment metagenome TaxID=412755 RepID=A0A0F9W1E3_9ZZZZ
MQLLEERKPARVRQKVYRLIQRGELVRASVCEECQAEAYTLPHHPDYDKPLEIRWLCPSCHAKLDCPAHKPKKRGHCADGRGNRPKTERNQKIMEYWDRGYRQNSIAKMFKMKVSAVGMVIFREKKAGR